MENDNLKLKIDRQIKILVEMINFDVAKEKIKKEQRILNKLLEEYLKDK